jgi:hypothetical protein
MKKQEKRQLEQLDRWQEQISKDEVVWSVEVSKMDERERQYKGEVDITAVCDGDKNRVTYHDTRTTYELIEAQIDTNIPSPKVTPIHKEDERLAKIIEDMLRNELERLPFAQMNDLNERTTPTQGAALFHVEWDNALQTHVTIGDLLVQTKHPKQMIPQAGIYTDLDDMDHFALKLPVTKAYVKRRYQVDVSGEGEEDPSAKALDGEASADDMVTQYVVYYKNDKGGIGIFSWVNDVVLEDLEDYQARRTRHCVKCGAVEPLEMEPLDMPTKDGRHPQDPFREGLPVDFDGNTHNPPRPEPVKSGKLCCPYCGSSKFTDAAEEFEELWLPRVSAHGVEIPGAIAEVQPVLDEEERPLLGEEGLPLMKQVMVPTKIPYYKPKCFPVILQKSVSIFGQLLGNSDVDAVKYQHNSRNRLAAKMLDKLVKGGSIITVPPNARIKNDSEDAKVLTLENAADKAMIGVYDLQGNITQDYSLYREFYEEGRNIVGVTNSYQGKIDNTATSGRAKEFSAAQAAGRLESKRTMKDAAYAKLFEVMFKFKLAYADEPRSIHAKNDSGETQYDVFDRYDFLIQDESGEWYWNDQFIFTCDTSASLASNREAMWQETRMNFSSGCFGDPTAIDTQILFWTKMAQLHYPDAESTKRYLQEKAEKQQQQQQQQQALAAKTQQQQQQQAFALKKLEMENQQAAVEQERKAKERAVALQEVGKVLAAQDKLPNEEADQNK